MLIRFAEKQDIPAMVKIYNQAIAARSIAVLEKVKPEQCQAWIEAHPRDKHPLLIPELDSVVVGYLYLSAYRPGRTALIKTCEVSYYVDYSYHRRGVASKLMGTCLKMCPGLGVKNLFAILLETNSSSIALLKKFSFERWAHLPEVAELEGKTVGQVYFGRKV